MLYLAEKLITTEHQRAHRVSYKKLKYEDIIYLHAYILRDRFTKLLGQSVYIQTYKVSLFLHVSSFL